MLPVLSWEPSRLSVFTPGSHSLLRGKVGPEDLFERRPADDLQLIAHPVGGMLEIHNASQVNRSADDDEIAGRSVNGSFQILDLLFPIAHGRQDRPSTWILFKGFCDGANGVGSRIDDLSSTEALTSISRNSAIPRIWLRMLPKRSL